MTTNDQSATASKPLLILLGVVAFAGSAYLALTLTTGNGDAQPDPPAAVASEPTVADATAPPAPGDDATETPSEIAAVEPTFEVFGARDPFEQLVSDDTGTGGAGAGDTVDGASPTGAVQPADSPTPPAATAPVDTADPTADSGGPSQTTVGGTTILLQDVYSDGGQQVAVLVVDSQGYDARAGETVAGVEVLDITGACATMRFDDNRFILCEGEQITK